MDRVHLRVRFPVGVGIGRCLIKFVPIPPGSTQLTTAFFQPGTPPFHTFYLFCSCPQKKRNGQNASEKAGQGKLRSKNRSFAHLAVLGSIFAALMFLAPGRFRDRPRYSRETSKGGVYQEPFPASELGPPGSLSNTLVRIPGTGLVFFLLQDHTLKNALEPEGWPTTNLGSTGRKVKVEEHLFLMCLADGLWGRDARNPSFSEVHPFFPRYIVIF